MNARLKLQSALLVICSTILIVIIHKTNPGRFLDKSVARPTEFSLRKKLNLEPRPSQNLKIIAYEGNSLEYFNAKELSISGFSVVLEKVLARKPKRVLIDKMFGLSISGQENESEFLNIISSDRVATAAISQNLPIGKRVSTDMSAKKLGIQKILKTDFIANGYSKTIPVRKYFYGPHADSETWFGNIGHITHHGNGYISPFVAIQDKSDDQFYLIVSYLGLLAADNSALDQNKLLVNDSVEMLVDGQSILPNLRSMKAFAPQMRSTKSIYQAAVNDEELTWINDGDIVLYLPFFYSGGTDFKETVNGRLPGGLVLASVANSVMEKDWLHSSRYNILWIVISGLASFLTIFIRSKLFLPWFILLSFSAVGSGFLLFLKFNTYIPWHLAFANICISSLGVHIMRFNSRQKLHMRIRASLGGFLSSKQVDSFSNENLDFNPPPEKKFISVVFIDLVGFSVIAEQEDPITVFNGLKDKLKVIFDLVHEHGGIINKTLGDGVLACFGLGFGDKEQDHANQAVKCAIAIQKISFKQAQDIDATIYPYRIGINTASICVGDLGNADRIDINIIGHGVNFCKRLEDSCEPFRIMMGPLTREMLSDSTLNMNFLQKRYASIKHHSELFDAFEYNPFQDRKDELAQVMNRYFNSRQVRRLNERIDFDEANRPGIRFNGDIRGEVQNISNAGLGVVCEKYFAKGAEINFEVEENHFFQKILVEQSMRQIKCKVVSGFSQNDRFYLGLKFLELSESKQKELFSRTKSSLNMQRINEKKPA